MIKAYVSIKYVFRKRFVLKILTISAREISWHQLDCNCIGILSLINKSGMNQQNIEKLHENFKSIWTGQCFGRT